MGNPFDQFDSVAVADPGRKNPFDQFDNAPKNPFDQFDNAPNNPFDQFDKHAGDLKPDKQERGLGDLFLKGMQQSGTAAVMREFTGAERPAPDEPKDFKEKAAIATGQLVGDLPLMVASGPLGMGSKIGQMAAAFAVPATIKEAERQNEKKTPKDRDLKELVEGYGEIAKEGAKEATVGAVTSVAGAGGRALAETMKFGGKVKGAAGIAAEIPTMLHGERIAHDGPPVTSDDYLLAAIQMFGIHGAIKGAEILSRVAERTGKRPQDIKPEDVESVLPGAKVMDEVQDLPGGGKEVRLNMEKIVPPDETKRLMDETKPPVPDASIKFTKQAEAKGTGENEPPYIPEGVEPPTKDYSQQYPKTVPDDSPLLKSLHEDRSPEREGRRFKIVNDYLSKGVPVEGRKPILYMLGGGAASGKGSLLKELKKSGDIPSKGIVEVDADEIKKDLPEYKALYKAGDYRAADVAHEESSILGRAIENLARKRNMDIIVDRTMGNPEKVMADLQKYKDAGYEVRLYGITVEPEDAVNRMFSRAKDSGRYVPLDRLLGGHKKFSEGWDQYLPIFDHYELWDNNVPHGEKPIKIAGSDVANPNMEKYNRFIDKRRINEYAYEDNQARDHSGRRSQAGQRAELRTQNIRPLGDAKEPEKVQSDGQESDIERWNELGTQDFLGGGNRGSRDQRRSGQPDALSTPKESIPGIDGRKAILKTSGGDIPITYRVVESSDLIASHHPETFSKNPSYPEGIQERQYQNDKIAQGRVIDQAQKFDPAFVINDSPTPVDGPPMITPDGIVLGGNSRTMTLQRVYGRGGHENPYPARLRETASYFGIPPETLAKFKNPVLVRQIDSPPSDVAGLRRLGSELNRGFTADLSTHEKAVTSGKMISPATMDWIGRRMEELGDATTLRQFMEAEPFQIVRRFLNDGVITQRDLLGLVDQKRQLLTEKGKDFFEKAMIGRVVDDPVLLSNIPASVTQKIAGALPSLVQLNIRGGGWDLAGDLNQAVDKVIDARARGLKADQYLAQTTMFENGGMTEKATTLFKMLMDDTAKTVKERFRQYAAIAAHDIEGQASLIEKPTPGESFDTIFSGKQAEAGGMQFYSGLPVDQMITFTKKAWENFKNEMKDRAGIPEKGIDITKPEIAKQPGVFSEVQSINRVAKKYPELKPVYKMGVEAVEVQEKLRDEFSRGFQAITRVLGENYSPAQRLLGIGKKLLQENTKWMDEILLHQDLIGRDLTVPELKTMATPESVIKALQMTRRMFDRALDIANEVKTLRGQMPVKRLGGYIPHFFHNFFVEADGAVHISVRTLAEAVAIGNKLARQGRAVRIKPKEFEFPGEQIQAALVGDKAYFVMKKKFADLTGLPIEKAAEILSHLVRTQGRTRFVGNFMERLGMAGWDRDMGFARSHYFNMIARFAGMDAFKEKSVTYFERKFGTFSKEYTGIAQYIKKYINDVNGVPTQAENLLNSVIANNPRFFKFLGAYLGDRPALQIAGMMTNSMAIAKLGMYNVSSALVNATQLVNIYAALGEKYSGVGMARAGKVMAEVAKRGGEKFFKADFDPESGMSHDLQLIHELGLNLQQGLESGAGYSKFGVGKLFRTTTAFFQSVEFMNRAVAGLGAFYKGMSEGMTRDQAKEYAREVNTRTNFDYSIADAPGFIRAWGPVSQVLFQFKKFGVKQLEFLTELQGAEHARFWLPFLALGGYYALPGMEFITNSAKQLFGLDLQLEFKNWLMGWAGDDPEKKAVAKTIFYGAFANDALGGIDISHRVGTGDFIPSHVNDLFGPFFSTATLAAQRAAHGQWPEVMRAISPGVGNALVAATNDGELVSPTDRERIVTHLTPSERVLKGLGFRPTREAVDVDTARVMTYKANQRKQAEKEAIDATIKAINSQDEQAIQRAGQKLGEMGIDTDRVVEEMEKKKLDKPVRVFMGLSEKDQYQSAPLLRFRSNEG